MDYKPKHSHKTILNFPLQLSPSWTYIHEGLSEKRKDNMGLINNSASKEVLRGRIVGELCFGRYVW